MSRNFKSKMKKGATLHRKRLTSTKSSIRLSYLHKDKLPSLERVDTVDFPDITAGVMTGILVPPNGGRIISPYGVSEMFPFVYGYEGRNWELPQVSGGSLFSVFCPVLAPEPILINRDRISAPFPISQRVPAGSS
jgi:hypothetical protein